MENVDKHLIKKLILERSERLVLEHNPNALARAWNFFYRVRIDDVLRPFAVCKTCFRVLDCDGSNPLSERSPLKRTNKKAVDSGVVKSEATERTDSHTTRCQSPTITSSQTGDD